MLRKLFTSFCLGAFVLSFAACSAGHGNEVKKGDPNKKASMEQKAKEDPGGTVRVAGPDE